jgi:hypothetical protein
MTIHGLLAAELAVGETQSPDWVKSVPTWDDFEATIPYLWPGELQKLLPIEAKKLVAKQQARFEKDWDTFRAAFPSKSRQDYLYGWLLINTRTFYYETSETLLFPYHDRLAMLPIADLFNHSENGCSVTYWTDGYTITTDRQYRAGEEVYTSYGEHSNDFLLAEYGFILKENRWDKVCLDDLILSKLSDKYKTELKDKGYIDDFMFRRKPERHDNIWIALRLLCCTHAHWQSYLNGEEDTEGTLTKATELLPSLLREYLDTIAENRRKLGTMKVGTTTQRRLLVQRWEQIEAIIRRALETNLWFV